MDKIRPGLRPRVWWAGTLWPLGDAAEDGRQRVAGVRGSASAVRRCTEAAGERLRAQPQAGRLVQPTPAEPQGTAPPDASPPAAWGGLEACRVPLHGAGASQAEQRIRDTALLATPEQEPPRYRVAGERAAWAEPVRWQARAVGVAPERERLLCA